MAQEYTNDDGSTGTYNEDGSGSYTGTDGSTQTWDADGGGPILVPMVPLVLILQMVRVPIPKQMVIHTAWMQMATEAIPVQMAHPVL